MSDDAPKILLLFGAGASHGSGGMTNPPPLSTELFKRLQDEYPETWGEITGSYKDHFLNENDFEKGMEAIYLSQDEHPYNLHRLLRSMGIYFDSFRIHSFKNNYYCRLAMRFNAAIAAHKIVIATLNYDCLLEYALNGAGIDIFSSWDKPMNTVPYLLKLHGSCNFIAQGFLGSPEGLTVNMKAGATFNVPVQRCVPGKVEQVLENSPLFPAMSLFVKDKTDIIAPGFIQSIREQYANFAKDVKVCIAVGVRPNEEDFHVWGPLKKVSKLFLVGGEEGAEWCKENGNATYLGSKFDEQYGSIGKIMQENF